MLTPCEGLSAVQRRRHVISVDPSGMSSLFRWVGCLQRALTCLAKAACVLAAMCQRIWALAELTQARMRADQRVTCQLFKAKACLLALHASHSPQTVRPAPHNLVQRQL